MVTATGKSGMGNMSYDYMLANIHFIQLMIFLSEPANENEHIKLSEIEINLLTCESSRDLWNEREKHF